MPSKNDEKRKGNKIKLKRLGLRAKTTKSGKTEKIDNNNKKNTKRKKIGWRVFKILLFTMLGLGVIGTGVVIGVLTGIIDKTENVDLAQLQSQKLTSFIYDTEEKEIAALFSEENRINISYEKTPKYLIDAVVSIEDERFWKHNGVDIKRTGAAIVTYIFNGGNSSFGGSTITQQLIKNSTGDKEADWTRKIREWYRAISLEKKLEKEDILESYLNTIYLGAGASGIEVASHTYFNKSVTEVNLAEAATLAAVIQLPETYNPYRGEEAAKKLKKRKEIVLAKMLELKKINKEEYEEALKYEIKYEKGKIATGTTYTYFVDAVIESVAADLMEKQNVSKEMALQMLYGNGYKIYTTQVPSVQKSIDEAFSNKSWFYNDKAGTFMQAGMVIIDNSNGNVVGLSGGAGEKETDRSFNRATQAIRQPGSTFKPISAYGPAFERGISYPGMGIDDSQLTVGNWTPRNYYGYFNGYVSARSAINLSMNIPAVRTLQSVGVDYGYEFAKKLGISTLNKNDKTLSLALGGLNRGVTVLDMTGAYSVFANNGIYLEPRLYTKVVDPNGKEILSNKESAQRVMKDTAAYLITDCLKTVVTTGTATSTRLGGGMETAGKTGNTNDDKDQWFAGYSPYYTAVVWNGYDQPKSINRPYPYTSMRVWTDVMKKVHSSLAAKGFTRPSGIVSATVCTHSGKIPTEACKLYGGVIKTEIFESGTVPTETCDVHKMATICKVTGKIANEHCLETEEKAYITRDTQPKIKPRDWNRMIITDKCTLHSKSSAEEDNGNVNPYN